MNGSNPGRRAFALLLVVISSACGGGGDSEDIVREPPGLDENPQFRAIGGISMGAYGALNIGSKHREAFGTILALGGPVDLRQLLTDTAASGLEVKPQTGIPQNVGDDFTFDHLPPYPGRDVNLSLVKDLFISLGNPFLHHPDPSRVYLAADSEPAAMRRDDAFGAFTPPADPRGFLDGGDGNDDGVRQLDEAPAAFADVLLAAKGSLAALAPGAAASAVGDRDLADLNGDGVFDVGDGLVQNLSEPFTDANGDGLRDASEAFQDLGLDGVAGTADFGEGNGSFDSDPDVASWLAEDPTMRFAGEASSEISRQRLYLDVGTGDEFGFAKHYDNLVGVLSGQGVPVAIQDGFRGSCASLPDFESAFQLVRYEGGHVGIPTADDIIDELFGGDVCGELILWRRLQSFFGFLDQSFPDGNYGVGEIDIIDELFGGDVCGELILWRRLQSFFGFLDQSFPDGNYGVGEIGIIDIDIEDFDFDVDFDNLDVRGEVVEADIPSPALQAEGGEVPLRHVVAYIPPEFPRSEGDFPVVYFLGGYGSEPSDFRSVSDLLDLLILTGELQNMYVVFLPGDGGVAGSFYVNHRVPEAQVTDVIGPTSGRYEDSILEDLIPTIERDLLRGRVRR
jgi:hypothetical protein